LCPMMFAKGHRLGRRLGELEKCGNLGSEGVLGFRRTGRSGAGGALYGTPIPRQATQSSSLGRGVVIPIKEEGRGGPVISRRQTEGVCGSMGETHSSILVGQNRLKYNLCEKKLQGKEENWGEERRRREENFSITQERNEGSSRDF